MSRIIKSTFLYSLIIFVTLLTVETGLRIYDVVSGDIIFDDLKKYAVNKLGNRAHPYLQYTASKLLRGSVHHIEPDIKFETTTNAHGFRTHEFYPKLPGKVRILLLGDSFFYGYNANDNETIQGVLEKRFHTDVSKDVEVFSLGVASYSSVRYAALARIYFEYLKPDIVVVAPDQSDFGEDVRRKDDYILDADGYPFVLKQFAKLVGLQSGDTEIAFTHEREMVLKDVSDSWKILVRAGSSLVNRAWEFQRGLKSKKNDAADYENLSIIKYEKLLDAYGPDISKSPYQNLWGNIIPYDLPTALEAYKGTYTNLEYVQLKTREVNADLFLSSYPYSWMVQLNQAMAYQANHYKIQIDFRGNRVHPNLMDNFSKRLGVPHLNSYPVFERDGGDNWGNWDPHFNARGYALYANYLFDQIKARVEEKLNLAQADNG
jgi:hypothetical protein